MIPEMSRRSPSGKHILPPTTFKMPAMATQPCPILKHLPKDLQAQEGRGVGNHQSADRDSWRMPSFPCSAVPQ